MKSTKLIFILFLVQTLVLLSNSVASTINYGGVDLTTLGDWRTNSIIKPLDIDGDNVYGTDGYYVVYSNYYTPSFFEEYPTYISSISEPGYRHTDGAPWGYEAIDYIASPTSVRLSLE